MTVSKFVTSILSTKKLILSQTLKMSGQANLSTFVNPIINPYLKQSQKLKFIIVL